MKYLEPLTSRFKRFASNRATSIKDAVSGFREEIRNKNFLKGVLPGAKTGWIVGGSAVAATAASSEYLADSIDKLPFLFALAATKGQIKKLGEIQDAKWSARAGFAAAMLAIISSYQYSQEGVNEIISGYVGPDAVEALYQGVKDSTCPARSSLAKELLKPDFHFECDSSIQPA